jgi:hypothetical protein
MDDKSATEQIDDIIKMYGGWKGETLSRLRSIISTTDPEIQEEVKWKMATRPWGLPVWTHNGNLCFAETWKDNIKLIFPKGVRMKDPNKLFNARLLSSKDRAIELREGDTIDGAALQALVREAMELNALKGKK